MINEGSGACTKKQRSCYEKYAERIRKTAELDEKQLRCTKPLTANRSPLTAHRSPLTVHRPSYSKAVFVNHFVHESRVFRAAKPPFVQRSCFHLKLFF